MGWFAVPLTCSVNGIRNQIATFATTCLTWSYNIITSLTEERGGSVVECRTPERGVGGSKPTAAVLCPWARHFTPRKYWLITQEAVAPSRHDWKIIDRDVKPQHKQTNKPPLPAGSIYSLKNIPAFFGYCHRIIDHLFARLEVPSVPDTINKCKWRVL